MAGSDRYITVKVLVSYLFLLFIAVFSVTYIYNLIEKTDLIEQSDALPRQKSYLVKQTLSLIYESEAIGQLLDQASNMGHYNRTLKQAKQNLDSLRSLTTDSVQQLKIDTIGQLLDQKRWYTKQLMETWKESLTERIYITNIERLIEIPDTVVNEVVIQKHIEVQQDTVVVPRKRLGFFKRLAEVFVPTKQDTSIIIKGMRRMSTTTCGHGHVGALLQPGRYDCECVAKFAGQCDRTAGPVDQRVAGTGT